MKVTMLGKSGSGKSTYMSALYESLFVTDAGGFKMKPTAKDIDESLGETGKFKRLSLSDRGDFPPATQNTTVWSFDLMYYQRTVCSFDWIDYRGGMIDEIFGLGYVGDEAKKREVSELLGHILLSNAVMIFADSIVLTKCDKLPARRKQSGANEINAIMEDVARFFPQHTLTVMILLTKVDSDEIDQSWRDNKYEKLVDRARETFKGTVDCCKAMSPTWLGGIVPVGCVGYGNVTTRIVNPGSYREPMVVENEIIDEPQPMNAAHPLFFCLGNTLMKMESTASYRRQQFENELDQLQRNSNKLVEFVKWLAGKQTDGEAVEELQQKIDAENVTIRELKPYINPLYDLSKREVKNL